MTKSALIAWILNLPAILDGHGYEIHRPFNFALALADVVFESPDPLMWAATLDVFAAKEASYRVDAVGDHGRSCGLGQTACAITPKDARGQLRLAMEIHSRSSRACPDHPLSLYGTGRCQVWSEGDARMRLIATAAATPMVGEADRDHDGVPGVIDFPPGAGSVIVALGGATP